MKVLNKKEREIIEWLIKSRKDSSITLADFLQNYFFTKSKNRYLIIQAQEKYAMYYLSVETYNNKEQKNDAVASLIELMALLNYLNDQGFITIYREGHQQKEQMFYIGDIFEKPHISDNKIILNSEGLYSAKPEKIQNNDNEVIYKGIELKNGNYDLIYQNLIGDIYISDSIETLLNSKIKRPLFLFYTLLILIVFIIGIPMIYAGFKLQNIDDQIRIIKQKQYTDNSQGQSISYGIDISRWNGNLLDNSPLPKKIKFVICKATQGVNEVDPMFKHNWVKLKDLGLRRGAYHSFISGDDAVAQAEHFWSVINDLNASDITPIVDIEKENIKNENELDTINFQVDLLTFLKTLETLSHRKPMIYASVAFANEHITHRKFSNYPLWVAEYTTHDRPRVPSVWKQKGYKIWQKSDKYDINSTNNDFDILFE